MFRPCSRSSILIEHFQMLYFCYDVRLGNQFSKASIDITLQYCYLYNVWTVLLIAFLSCPIEQTNKQWVVLFDLWHGKYVKTCEISENFGEILWLSELSIPCDISFHIQLFLSLTIAFIYLHVYTWCPKTLSSGSLEIKFLNHTKKKPQICSYFWLVKKSRKLWKIQGVLFKYLEFCLFLCFFLNEPALSDRPAKNYVMQK